MDSPPPDLPDDIAMLRAELALARARMADDAATIARQNLEIAKLQRRIYGARSERTARLIDQMEPEFEDIEAAATEDEIAAEQAAAKTTKVVAVTRKRPSRQPFPAHLPRERVLVPGPTACECCGGGRLRKLGETITGTLEVIPRQWKVIRHVREKMTCRDCERIYVRDDRPFKGGASPAAMFYYSRDRGGAHVEAHLARWSGLLQADAYSGCNRLYDAGRKPAPILEAGCWSHARRPFFVLADIESSARRKAEGKVPVPISPLALEAVRRIDRLFEIERGINGKSAEERRAVRQELSRPLVADLEAWMRQQRPKCAFRRQRRGESPGWSPMDYMLKRWPAFTCFLDDLNIIVLLAIRHQAAAMASSTSRKRSLPKYISSPTKKVGLPKLPRATEASVAFMSASLTA